MEELWDEYLRTQAKLTMLQCKIYSRLVSGANLPQRCQSAPSEASEAPPELIDPEEKFGKLDEPEVMHAEAKLGKLQPPPSEYVDPEQSGMASDMDDLMRQFDE